MKQVRTHFRKRYNRFSKNLAQLHDVSHSIADRLYCKACKDIANGLSQEGITATQLASMYITLNK